MTRTRGVLAAIEQLSTGAQTRRTEMIRLLKGLGFTIRDGKKQGHVVIAHQGLQAFTSASISCGHGTNPQIKPVYVVRVRKLLETHADELQQQEGDQM